MTEKKMGRPTEIDGDLHNKMKKAAIDLDLGRDGQRQVYERAAREWLKKNGLLLLLIVAGFGIVLAPLPGAWASGTGNATKLQLLDNATGVYDAPRGLPSIMVHDNYSSPYFTDALGGWVSVWPNNYFHGLYGWRPFLNTSYSTADFNSIDYFFKAQKQNSTAYEVAGTFPVYANRLGNTTKSLEGYYWDYHNNADDDNSFYLGCNSTWGYDIDVDAQYLTVISAADHLLWTRNLSTASQWYPGMQQALSGLDSYASSSLGCGGLRLKMGEVLPISGIQGTLLEYAQERNSYQASTLVYAIAAYHRMAEVAKLLNDTANATVYAQREADLRALIPQFLQNGSWFIGGQTISDSEEVFYLFVNQSANPWGMYYLSGWSWTPGAGGSLVGESATGIYRLSASGGINSVNLTLYGNGNMFYAGGAGRTLYIDLSSDNQNWITTYSYNWAGEGAIKPPTIYLPPSMNGRATIYLRIRTVGEVQWYFFRANLTTGGKKYGGGLADGSNSSYFETYPNVDAVMLRVANASLTASILQRMGQIPGLTNNSLVLINYPARPIEETVNPGGDVPAGVHVNAGAWWTTSASTLYVYASQNSTNIFPFAMALWKVRVANQSRDYYNDYGSTKYATNASLGDAGAWGFLLRGMYGLEVTSSNLTITPHIPIDIDNYNLSLPILWGGKTVYINIKNNSLAGIGNYSVKLNGVSYPHNGTVISVTHAVLGETNILDLSYAINPQSLEERIALLELRVAALEALR